MRFLPLRGWSMAVLAAAGLALAMSRTSSHARGNVYGQIWGMAIAPREFGAFGGSLLVGNFGDGTIAAFDVVTGRFLDCLRHESAKPITIDGLWGLAFGNGVTLGDADSLYFTAGPNQEQDGIFGRLRFAASAAKAR